MVGRFSVIGSGFALVGGLFVVAAVDYGLTTAEAMTLGCSADGTCPWGAGDVVALLGIAAFFMLCGEVVGRTVWRGTVVAACGLGLLTSGVGSGPARTAGVVVLCTLGAVMIVSATVRGALLNRRNRRRERPWTHLRAQGPRATAVVTAVRDLGPARRGRRHVEVDLWATPLRGGGPLPVTGLWMVRADRFPEVGQTVRLRMRRDDPGQHLISVPDWWDAGPGGDVGGSGGDAGDAGGAGGAGDDDWGDDGDDGGDGGDGGGDGGGGDGGGGDGGGGGD